MDGFIRRLEEKEMRTETKTRKKKKNITIE